MDSVRILQLKRGVEELEFRVMSLEQQVDNGDLLTHLHTTSTSTSTSTNTPIATQGEDVAEMAARLTRLLQQLNQHTDHLNHVKLMADANLAKYSQSEAVKELETTVKSQHIVSS
ncbi:hypothetical protein Pcinc_023692 [Petrolisthes cinctipes]|uniref:Uncharacterized protein n=1 Tax=Petrolisthes cinctipes TaxID=88211 RepID=A0AAE1FD06_PETCI|nr:hypothetical protein Pcinc_023692 [Petrolisthes cinctipes]